MIAFWIYTGFLYTIRLLGILVTLGHPRWDRRWRNALTMLWARGVLRLLGIKLVLKGQLPEGQIFLVSNHLSYVDIFVFSSVLNGVYVAKSEVANWPLIGRLAQTVGTIFIDRSKRSDLVKVHGVLNAEWSFGQSVIAFPEGTSSDGHMVLPLKPGLLEFPAARGLPVHYATVSYRVDGCLERAASAVCWWGDMTFPKHFFALMGLSGIQGTLNFGVFPVQSCDRKQLAARLRREMQTDLNAARLVSCNAEETDCGSPRSAKK